MTDLPAFIPDCASCAALCCIALAFDKGAEFALDKPAGLPCPKLAPEGFACTVHDRLEDAGFAGCAHYDCLGAGQRVVSEVFDGDNWRENPALTGPMIEAFASMRRVHEGLELIETSARLDLPAPLEAERRALRALYLPAQGWSEESLAAFDESGTPRRLAAFLASLRDFV